MQQHMAQNLSFHLELYKIQKIIEANINHQLSMFKIFLKNF